MRSVRAAVPPALGLAVLCAAAAHAGPGVSMTPMTGYLDTVVEIRSTTHCPESGEARILLWKTSETGRNTSVTVPTAADGSWRYRGAIFEPVPPGRYWFVANCVNEDGDGVMTYEPGWSFTVDTDSFHLEGRTPPPPRPSPVPTTPAPPPTTSEPPATSAPPRVPLPVRTATPARATAKPRPATARPAPLRTTAPPTTSPATTPPATSPVAVPLTAQGDGSGLVAVAGAGAAALLAGAGGVLLVRRRRSSL